jgi:hypothetical protein
MDRKTAAGDHQPSVAGTSHRDLPSAERGAGCNEHLRRLIHHLNATASIEPLDALQELTLMVLQAQRVR